MSDWENHFGSEEWFIGRKYTLLKKDEKQNELDQTLFDEMCTGNKNELVGIEFINQGATNDYCDMFGRTALHMACSDEKEKVVKKILEKYPNQIEAKTIREGGFRTPIGNAFYSKKYRIAELLLKLGAKNVILNLLEDNEDYITKLKLIEKYRDIKDELKDLILMENLGLLKEERYINNISMLIEYYKNEDEIRNCLESIIARCHLFRSIDSSVEPLLWNYRKSFLASYFYERKINEKISISCHNNELKVSYFLEWF